MENVMEEEIKVINSTVAPEDHVICALSGGVDSTVAATLVYKAIGDRLHCIFVDNGLLRWRASSLINSERLLHYLCCRLHLCFFGFPNRNFISHVDIRRGNA